MSYNIGENTTSYVIYKKGNVYIAENGSTGEIDYSGEDAATVINQAITNGDEIFIKSGIYTITTPIILDNYTKLYGEGFNTILKCADNTSINVIEANTKTNIIIRDLAIDGNKANQSFGGDISKQCGIFFNACEYSIIDSVYIYNPYTYGIKLQSLTTNRGNTISNCYVSGADSLVGSTGIALWNRAEYNRVIGCHVVTSTIGFRVEGGNNVITGCTALFNTYGFEILYLSDSSNNGKNTIIGCKANHNDYGIKITDCNLNEINGCHIVANNYHGLVLEGTSHNNIVGNWIGENGQGTSNTYDNIYITTGTYNSTNNTIANNYIYEYDATPTARYGINEADTNCDYNLIKNNYVDGALTANIRVQGTNTKLVGNSKDIPLHIISELSAAGDAFLKLEDGTTGGYFSFGESTSSAGAFSPALFMHSAHKNGIGGAIMGELDAENDVLSTNDAAVILQGQSSAYSALTAANILAIRNWATSLVTVTHDGKVGIGDTTPNSLLQINGSLAVKRIATAANYTTAGETIIGVTDTTAARTITLATADCVVGRLITIKDESGGAGTHSITIATEGSETIDGASTATISTNYGVLRIYSDGNDWFII